MQPVLAIAAGFPVRAGPNIPAADAGAVALEQLTSLLNHIAEGSCTDNCRDCALMIRILRRVQAEVLIQARDLLLDRFWPPGRSN